ncbi:MAG: phosphonate C-P lyase system protein PhnH [Clostridia bacterium]|nr:phosphonate C-P lyase system protein PhnH [Clostridia bacterium]
MQQIVKEAGFDEVFDSQRIFRVIMEAMSYPGRIKNLGEHCFKEVADGLNPYSLLILKTLCDNCVKFGISSKKSDEWKRYIEINTGAGFDKEEAADFVLFEGNDYSCAYERLNKGTSEFPENSATAIISVERIYTGINGRVDENGMRVRIKGPGVKSENLFALEGLDLNYLTALPEINSEFPIGIDVMLIDWSGNIVCIPRTSKVEVA